MGRRNEHTRDEIQLLALDAAAAIVEADGLSALSARKVASAIGYTVGSLYNVFHNFDELVMRMNARSLELLTAKATAAITPPAPPADQLRALARAYVDFAFDNRNLWAAIFEHQGDSQNEVDPWPGWYRELSGQPMELIASQLVALTPDESSASIERATQTLFSGVHGACLLAIHKRLQLNTRDSVLDVADTLIDTWLGAHDLR